MDNLIVHDSSGNSVSLAGKNITDTEGLIVAEGNINFLMEFSVKMTIQGESFQFTTKGAFSQNHTSDVNSPCVFLNPYNNCRVADVSHTTSSTHPELDSEDGYILVTNNLFYSSGDDFFTDGFIEFTINDWEGTTQYGSDGSTPPSIQASNGSESVEGTYNDESSLLFKPGLTVNSSQNQGSETSSLQQTLNKFVSRSLKQMELKLQFDTLPSGQTLHQ